MDKNLIYQIILKLKDQISAPIDKVKKEFRAVDDAAKKAQSTTGNFQSVCDRISKLQFGNMVTLLDRSAQAFNTMGDKGMGFQQSMADLSSITGIVGGDLSDLARVARETGKNSGLGAKGAADAFALLASQIQVDKIGMEGLKVLQKETITLAQASGMGMADAATAMAATINQFGLEAGEANRVINVLAAGSKYGAAEIVDLAQSFKVTGATAASAGLSVEQTAGALEVLSKSNLKGAEAGTALRNILLKIQTDLKVDFGETGLSTALEALKPKLNDVTYLAKLFGAENISAAQFLITNASAVDEMTQAVTGTSVAQEQAAIRTDTVAEKTKRMQASVDDAKIALFNVTGALTPYVMILGESLPAMASFISITGVCSQAVAYLQQQHVLAKAAVLGKMAVEKTAAAVTGLMTAAQSALNAVMSANPVALVVLAIAALVAGFIVAYKNCEGFRKTVDAAWAAIKNLAQTIWNNLVKAFEAISSVLTPIWSKLKALLGIEEEVTETTTQTSASINGLADANGNAVSGVNAFTLALGNQGKELNKNLATIGGVEQKISDLRTAQKRAMGEQAIALEKEINLWEKKLKKMQDAIIIGAADKPDMQEIKGPVKGLDLKKMKAFNPQTDPKNGGLKMPVGLDEKSLDKMTQRAQKKMKTMFGKKDMFSPAIEGISGVADIMQSLSGVVGESAGAWMQWGASLLQTIATAIPQIIALGNTQVAAATAQTTANTAVAASGAAASVASIPVVGWIMAGAAVASIIAMLAAVPKPKAFATGGVVSGPTLALVGEYSGASNNPEVIAPLNKLKSMIEPSVSMNGLRLETKIRGKDLYIALRNVEHEITRTR